MRVWIRLNRYWNGRYYELSAFVKKHGRMPECSDGDGSLWKWACKQRREKNTDKVSWKGTEKKQKLERIPGWTWDVVDTHEKNWERNYQELLQFVLSLKRFPFPEEKRLYTWVQTQRCARRKGTLFQDREKKLEKIPGWEWKPSRISHRPSQKEVAKRQKMAELKASGWRTIEIAGYFGCSRQNVHHLLTGGRGARRMSRRGGWPAGEG